MCVVLFLLGCAAGVLLGRLVRVIPVVAPLIVLFVGCNVGLIVGGCESRGELIERDLPRYEVFETLSAVKITKGFWAVIVRTRIGGIRAYRLRDQPPPIFRVDERNQPTPISIRRFRRLPT